MQLKHFGLGALAPVVAFVIALTALLDRPLVADVDVDTGSVDATSTSVAPPAPPVAPVPGQPSKSATAKSLSTPTVPTTTPVSTPKPPPAIVDSPGLRVYNPARGLPVVLYFHGVGESPNAPLFAALLQSVADAGFEVVVGELGGPATWGNSDAVAAAVELKSRFSPNRPVRLLAASMGGLGLLNYANSHLDDVVSAVGIVPATSLRGMAADFQSVIASTRPLPLEPRTAVTFPYQIWFGTEDLIVGPPAVTGPGVELHPMPTGHVADLPIDLGAITRFLRSGGPG